MLYLIYLMKRFRTFLLWLMIALLPLHAMAAGLAMSCSDMHGKPASTAMHHQADAPAGSHHASPADHGAAHAAPADHGDAADADDEGAHSCSVCSAFCSVPAVPASVLIAVPDYDGSESLLATPFTPLTGFIPEGPRRPTRHHSV